MRAAAALALLLDLRRRRASGGGALVVEVGDADALASPSPRAGRAGRRAGVGGRPASAAPSRSCSRWLLDDGLEGLDRAGLLLDLLAQRRRLLGGRGGGGGALADASSSRTTSAAEASASAARTSSSACAACRRAISARGGVGVGGAGDAAPRARPRARR